MKCGYCKGNHDTVDQVVACYRQANDTPLPERSRAPQRSTEQKATPKQVRYAESLLARRPSIKPEKPVKLMDRREISIFIDFVKSKPLENTNARDLDYQPGADITGDVPPDGRYTVVMPDGRRTIRFHTPQQGNFAGQRLVKYLTGADNDSDYTAIGKVVDGGVSLWQRFRVQPERLVIRAVSFLLKSGKEEWASAGETYALESSNCYRCGRTLTVPASIHRGLGPDCAGKAEM